MSDVIIGSGFLPTTGGTLSGDLTLASGTNLVVTSGNSDIGTHANPISNIFASHATFTTISGSSPIQFLSPLQDASGNSLNPVSIFSEAIDVLSSGSNLVTVTLSKNALSFLSCFIYYNISGSLMTIAPNFVASDPTGTLYTIDGSSIMASYVSGNQSLVRIAGQGNDATSENFPATGISSNFSALAIDENHNIYFCDSQRVRMINSSGLVSTIVNTGNVGGFSGDGGPATAAQLNNPVGLAASSGNLYICDINNERVRKVDSSGIITTFAGDGNFNTWDGSPTPATGISLINPTALTIDTNGDVYVGLFNFGANFIPRIDSNGIAHAFAGNGIDNTFNGDGIPASGAGLSFSNAMRFINGNLYFSQPTMQRIRYISSGNIYTLAGTGVAGYNGDGIPATGAAINLNASFQQNGIGVFNGNIVFSDYQNSRIRSVDNNGIISTVLGNGTFNSLYGEYIFNTQYASVAFTELAKRQNIISSAVITHSGNILNLDLTKISNNLYPASGLNQILVTYLTNE